MTKVTVLYRGDSEQVRQVTDFDHEYAKRTGRHLSIQDTNTKDGTALAELYGIMQFPAVLATADDGTMLQLWQGEVLPLINEVMYYQQN
jgi:hypothetical protein